VNAHDVTDCPTHFISAADIESNEHALAIAERAYRRGYQQGFYKAMEAIKSRLSVSKAERFLYGKLHKWRYPRGKIRFEFPPNPPVENDDPS
jgi:hypothetical protein